MYKTCVIERCGEPFGLVVDDVGAYRIGIREGTFSTDEIQQLFLATPALWTSLKALNIEGTPAFTSAQEDTAPESTFNNTVLNLLTRRQEASGGSDASDVFPALIHVDLDL